MLYKHNLDCLLVTNPFFVCAIVMMSTKSIILSEVINAMECIVAYDNSHMSC